AQKNFKEANLNFKYRKSLINKCENCGMLITGYRKSCPTCGQAIELKEIVKKCKNCGMLITKSVKICPICRKRTTILPNINPTILIISGLIGAFVFRNKKSIDFLNFCWIILYCGIGSILVGFLYGEFFGMHDIELFGTIFLHLEPVTIPILNITLHNPLNNILVVFKFAILIGVIHINLGWFIQFLNYWKQHRKYLGFTGSLVKIWLLTGGTILIFTFGFDIYVWMAPPYPILLPLLPGILLILLKPFGKLFHVSYLKEETIGGLIGEGTMESFETLLSIMSNVASYTR
ncbi:unnamed protein product, partial [marine sediment metagenome]